MIYMIVHWRLDGDGTFLSRPRITHRRVSPQHRLFDGKYFGDLSLLNYYPGR